MSNALRISLAALGPTLTLLFVLMSKERPLQDTVQLFSVSFGVAAVALGVGYVVRLRRGPGIRSVALTTSIGVALVLLTVLLGGALSAQLRAWMWVLLVTAPLFTFPSVFGAALATCAGVQRATSSSPSQTAS